MKRTDLKMKRYTVHIALEKKKYTFSVIDERTFNSKNDLFYYLKTDAMEIYNKNKDKENYNFELTVFDNDAIDAQIVAYTDFNANTNAFSLIEMFGRVQIGKPEKFPILEIFRVFLFELYQTFLLEKMHLCLH